LGAIGRSAWVERSAPGRSPARSASQVQGRRGIGQNQADPLALGVEDLAVRASGARGHPPVDVSSIIARRIRPRLGVIHAPAALRRNRLGGLGRTATIWGDRSRSQPAQLDQLAQIGLDGGDGARGGGYSDQRVTLKAR
jgi:hypothetical protein